MRTVGWNDWGTFCRVVEAGSSTAAAEMLSTPKSITSATVSRLEAGLGVRPMTRTTRQLRLTEAGLHFHDDIASLFERLREVHADTTMASETVADALHIVAPYKIGVQHLTGPACRTLEKHPHLQIQAYISWEQPDLLASSYDIVFVMVDQVLPDFLLVAHRVVLIPRGLYASPTLLAEYPLPKTPIDLVDQPRLSGPDDVSWALRPVGEPAIEPIEAPIRPYLQTLNAEVHIRATVRGLGVACVTRSVGDTEVVAGRLVRVLSGFELIVPRVHTLMPARGLVPHRVRVLLDTLKVEGASATPAPV